MAEQRFAVIKHVGKTPSMATCERCRLKFFVPMAFLNDPEGAEEHLRQKYVDHKCKVGLIPLSAVVYSRQRA